MKKGRFSWVLTTETSFGEVGGWLVGSEGSFGPGLRALHWQLHFVAVLFFCKGPSVCGQHVNGSQFVMSKLRSLFRVVKAGLVLTDAVLQLILSVVLVWNFVRHFLIRVFFLRLINLRLAVKFLLLSQLKWSVTGLGGERVLASEVYFAEGLGWESCHILNHSFGLCLLLSTPHFASLGRRHSLLD